LGGRKQGMEGDQDGGQKPINGSIKKKGEGAGRREGTPSFPDEKEVLCIFEPRSVALRGNGKAV